MGFTESSIRLDFPDEKYFRFEDLDTYRSLSGLSFKEMDACWYDEENKMFYLIELKDFTEANLFEEQSRYGRTFNLLKKSIDSLVMMLSMFLATSKGNELKSEISFDIPKETKLYFISILHIKETQRDYLNFIRDKYRNEFIAYAKLFSLHHTIVSRKKAIEKFTWVKEP